MSESRYIIGIDLGTSNCALSFVDTLHPERGTQTFLITQEIDDRSRGEQPLLPSFWFLERGESKHREIVGERAKRAGSYQPEQVISSAKSWLAHHDELGRDSILPWGSSALSGEEKRSAVHVSSAFLAHLKQCWDEVMAHGESSYRFEEQRVTITVPASFTEYAQSLTLEAAQSAGYPSDISLLEEPQAAFYCWLEENAKNESSVEAVLELFPDISSTPKTFLVCDIGGGTTDFSLFELTISDGALKIDRTRVSDHLLLGGDNIDLSIAHFLEPQLKGEEASIPPSAWLQLTAQSRELKERVLSEQEDIAETYHVSVTREGSSLFANTTTASAQTSELQQLILEGFFPFCDADAKTDKAISGIRELGLPYANDPRITHHLAEFLSGQVLDGVLFAGGTLASASLRARLSENLQACQEKPITFLESPSFLESIARGAARYGYIFEKSADIIRGGYPRTMYLEVETKKQKKTLVCIIPRGTEYGTSSSIDDCQFRALVGQPIRLQVFFSNIRSNDSLGTLVSPETPDIHPLPPLQTVLELPPGVQRPPHDLLQVALETSITETGLLQLSLSNDLRSETPLSWTLSFNVRTSEKDFSKDETQESDKSREKNPKLKDAIAAISHVFGKGKDREDVKPRRLNRDLETALGEKRGDWSLATLRSLWPTLERGMTRKNRSKEHEVSWLYLAGLCLRPGYGSSLDASYVSQLWRLNTLGLQFKKEREALDQWYIMWRRVCGGLTEEQQSVLFQDGLKAFTNSGKHIQLELVRMLCALERVNPAEKVRLGKVIIKRIGSRPKSGAEHLACELGRLGCRVPLYASNQYCVDSKTVLTWLRSLVELDWSENDRERISTIFAQACRISGDRSVDLKSEEREEAIELLRSLKASEDSLEIVSDHVPVTDRDKKLLFGEAMPIGLQLIS